MSQTSHNTFSWKATFHALEDLEKLIMSELQEFQDRKLSIDPKKFNSLMLALNVDYFKSEKLEINISHTLFNAKILLHAPSSWEVHQKMFLMKCKEISMTVSELQRTFIPIPDYSLEVELPKWKYPLESTKKLVNMRVLSNFHSELVINISIIVGYAI